MRFNTGTSWFQVRAFLERAAGVHGRTQRRRDNVGAGTLRAVRPNCTVDLDDGARDAYVWVDDADELYAEFRIGGRHHRPGGICDQIYGCRDFEIDDCNGYRLV